MDPVLQRFGDVTIQRLEKPKVPAPQGDAGSNAVEKEKEEESSGTEDETNDETLNLKRSFPDSQISIKKFKLDTNAVTIEKKIIPEEAPTDIKKISEDILSNKHPKYNSSDEMNFSDTELSDFDSESEMESESEIMIPGDKTSTIVKSNEDEDSTSASFLDKLVEDSLVSPESEPPTPVKSQDNVSGDNEDYDFDIKEKLKEMGEISFQTVKKGDIKPKKVEVSTENEVVVTPARKPGKFI